MLLTDEKSCLLCLCCKVNCAVISGTDCMELLNCCARFVCCSPHGHVRCPAHFWEWSDPTFSHSSMCWACVRLCLGCAVLTCIRFTALCCSADCAQVVFGASKHRELNACRYRWVNIAALFRLMSCPDLRVMCFGNELEKLSQTALARCSCCDPSCRAMRPLFITSNCTWALQQLTPIG